MDKGKIVAMGTYRELIQLVGGQTRIDLAVNIEKEKIIPAWRTVDGVSQIDSTNGTISAIVTDSNLVLPKLFETAAKLNARITSVEIKEPNLETVFMHLTGKALRD